MKAIRYYFLVLMMFSFVFPMASSEAENVIRADEKKYQEIKAREEADKKTNGGPGDPSTTDGRDPISFGGDGDNIHNSANEGANAEMIGAAVNGVVGAGLMAYCATCTGSCHWACAMGAMALAQAATNFLMAGASEETADASQFGGGINTDGGYQTPTFDTGDLSPEENTALADFKRLNVPGKIKELEDKGYKVNDDGTVTTPAGTFPASSFGSAGGISALGEDGDKAMSTVDKLAKAAKDKYRVVAMGTGGGGGGSGFSAGDYKYESPLGSYLDALKNKGKKRKPASVAGMNKVVGGTKIGVAADDIFKMIHRKYQQKRKMNTFNEDPNAGARARRK